MEEFNTISEPMMTTDGGGIGAGIGGGMTTGGGDLGDHREELTEFLRSKLIECGWRDQVANMCRNLIQKYGVEQIKLAQIIGEVRDEARQQVPEQVKTELLTKMRKLNQEIKTSD